MSRISASECLSLLGLPARVLGRLPLLVRYVYRLGRKPSKYGKDRYPSSYVFRVGLWFDAPELEAIEYVIHGTDEEVDAFRRSRLATASTTGAVVS